ncbi:HNH/ENDO VII family nuclease [Hamadaea sp. NPDC050747]|uniref:HNH/ENDO VII family nuclease n=1 Tax=Hamadaea sp. NPDC050747 TaxID=3155789 RepID=UPI0033EC66F0
MARAGKRAVGKLAGEAAEGLMKPLAKVVKKGDVLPGVTKAAKKAAKKSKDVYRRPKGFRKGVRDKAWNAAKGPDGKVRDPLTGKVMDKKKPWDMGHKPGYEFRKHRDSARQRKITRKKFLDEHNDPSHYRPELPSSNQSHAGEDHTDDYLGP